MKIPTPKGTVFRAWEGHGGVTRGVTGTTPKQTANFLCDENRRNSGGQDGIFGIGANLRGAGWHVGAVAR